MSKAGTVQMCMRAGCTKPATCALAVAFYPVHQVQMWHANTDPMARLVLDLTTCDEHSTPPLSDVMSDAIVAQLCEQLARANFTQMDGSLTRLQRVEFDDPEWTRLCQAKDAGQVPATPITLKSGGSK